MHKLRRPTAIVQVEGEDEIELVKSNEISSSSSEGDEYEIDIIEEATSLEIAEEGKEEPKSSSSSSIDVEVGTTEVMGPPKTGEMKEGDAAEPTNTVQKYISPDNNAKPSILEEKMNMLRSEMDKAEVLDPEKRMKMEKLFLQVEGAIHSDDATTITTLNSTTTINNEQSEAQSNSESTPQPNAFDHMRRTAVAITGGTLTAAGIVLIPCPIIPGCLVVYGGLAVLATEFDAAKNALDTVKEPLVKWLADDDEDAMTNDAKSENQHNSLTWENLIGHTPPDECNERKQDIDDDFMTLLHMKDKSGSGANDDVSSGQKGATDTAAAAAIRPLKPFLRKLLNLESAGPEPSKSNSKYIDTSDSKKELDKEENKQAEAHEADCTSPLSLGGCQPLSFDPGDDDDDNNEFTQIFCSDYGNKNLTQGQLLQRLQSDGSITLNTLANDGDEGIFSRQNTVSSIEEVGECLWT